MTLHSTLSIFATYWHAPHKKNLVPVFQKVDSAIHQINLYSVDWVQLVSLILVRWIEISPLDSVFSNILPNWISSCLLKCYLWQPFTILQCSRFCISLQQFSWASKVWIINKDEYNSNDFSHYRTKLFSFFYFLLHFRSESPSQAILFLTEWILATLHSRGPMEWDLHITWHVPRGCNQCRTEGSALSSTFLQWHSSFLTQ